MGQNQKTRWTFFKKKKVNKILFKTKISRTPSLTQSIVIGELSEWKEFSLPLPYIRLKWKVSVVRSSLMELASGVTSRLMLWNWKEKDWFRYINSLSSPLKAKAALLVKIKVTHLNLKKIKIFTVCRLVHGIQLMELILLETIQKYLTKLWRVFITKLWLFPPFW